MSCWRDWADLWEAESTRRERVGRAMSGGLPGQSFSLGIFTVTALFPLALHQRLTPDGTWVLSMSCPCRSGFAVSRSLLAPVTLLSPPRHRGPG